MQYSNDSIIVKQKILVSFPLGTQDRFGGEIAFGFQGDKVIAQLRKW
jgi:hypothetical protein